MHSGHLWDRAVLWNSCTRTYSGALCWWFQALKVPIIPYGIQLHDVTGNVIGSAPAEWAAFPGSFHTWILCQKISRYRGSHKHSKNFCSPCFQSTQKESLSVGSTINPLTTNDDFQLVLSLKIGSEWAQRACGTGRGGWVHLQGANSMAMSWLVYIKPLVGSRWATSLLLCIEWA